jgi:class 3 adenylate cyclase/prephenate dehydratase
MSATPDSTLADAQQLIADLQRQLAECKAERDEALQQQTATAEVLQVINSSPGHLSPVFDTMLEKAIQVCDAEAGVFCTYDGECFWPVAHRGLAEYPRDPIRSHPETGSGRLARGEDIVHILDSASGAPVDSGDPGRLALLRLGGARTQLAAALRTERGLIGTFTIWRREVRPFSDRQIALLQNFAAQAVIAMENARLLTETREALDQQTAIAELLQVINASPGDLAPVFDVMMERATRLCDAAFGVLSTVTEEGYINHRSYSGPSEIVEFFKKRPINRPGPGTTMDRLVRGESCVHVPDLIATDAYRNGDPVRRAMADTARARTLISVALRKDGTLLGTLSVYRQEVRPFTDKQIALLQNFAAQAVIAMENARLLTETREALEQQTATAEVLQVINSSPGDLAPVFDSILEKAHTLCGVALGSFCLVDGERMPAVATRGYAEEHAVLARTGFPTKSQLGDRLARGEIIHTPDLRETTGSQRDQTASEINRLAVEMTGSRTYLAVPLRKAGVLLGYLSAHRREVRPFTNKEIALLQNFAAQAVIAMENARLITETRKALEQQTATAEVLQVINSSPGDLEPVFDAMLDKAITLSDSVYGHLLTYNGEFFDRVAVRGEPRMVERQSVRRRAESGITLERIVRGESVVQIADVMETNAYRAGNLAARVMVDEGGCRTLLTVALRKEETLLGTLSVYRRGVRPFTDKQIALLQNFAAQAVIAIENARLLDELRQRTDQIAELNRGLEARVAEQVEELGRVGRLKRFLAPQLAELIVSRGDEKILESHRREIVVVFCDLRGYTAFTETAEPEEVLDFLREYHGALGPLVSQFEGTLDQFSGDGIMVFFNDPVPCPDPAERAVKMAMAMREAAGKLIVDWRERGRDLGFGAGIAQGYATLGQIGFSERSGYTAIGTVCNVAARLCAEAKDGQILLSQRVNVALKGSIATEQLGPLALKGLTQPVVAYNVPLAAIQPALRVIEGGVESV